MSAMQYLVRAIRIGAIAMPVAAGLICAAAQIVYVDQVASCSDSSFSFPVVGTTWRVFSPLPIAAFLLVGWRRPAGLADVWRTFVVLVFGYYLFLAAMSFYIPPDPTMCTEQGLDSFDFLVQDLFVFLGIPATIVSGLIAAWLLPFKRMNHEH